MSQPNVHPSPLIRVFPFHTPAPTPIYTLSLHDALPISPSNRYHETADTCVEFFQRVDANRLSFDDVSGSMAYIESLDRKSTRLNSSHLGISYAVFCLKKKKRYII